MFLNSGLSVRECLAQKHLRLLPWNGPRVAAADVHLLLATKQKHAQLKNEYTGEGREGRRDGNLAHDGRAVVSRCQPYSISPRD